MKEFHREGHHVIPSPFSRPRMSAVPRVLRGLSQFHPHQHVPCHPQRLLRPLSPLVLPIALLPSPLPSLPGELRPPSHWPATPDGGLHSRLHTPAPTFRRFIGHHACSPTRHTALYALHTHSLVCAHPSRVRTVFSARRPPVFSARRCRCHPLLPIPSALLAWARPLHATLHSLSSSRTRSPSPARTSRAC